MKTTLLSFAAVAVLAGCSSSNAPQNAVYGGNMFGKDIDEDSQHICNYESLSGTEFVITQKAKDETLAHFTSHPNYPGQEVRAAEYYEPLYNERFKFTGTVIPKKFSILQHREVIEVDGNPYFFNLASDEYAEVVTSSCKTFWQLRTGSINNIKTVVEKAEDSAYTASDYKSLLDTDNFYLYEMPNVDISESKNNDSVILNGSIINRMFFGTKANKFITFKDDESVGLFATIISEDGDAHEYTYASDDKGTLFEYKPFGHNKHCEGTSCLPAQTVGVIMPYSYLAENKDGFDVILSGKKPTQFEVHGFQVQQMLEGLEPYRHVIKSDQSLRSQTIKL